MSTDPFSVIVRAVLQNVSLQYRNLNYVADDIFPLIDGVHKQAKVAKYQKGAWFRDEAQVRAPGTPAHVSEYPMTTKNLDPVNYADATMVTQEDRAAANEPGSMPIQPDIDALEFIADKLDMKRETRTSALLHAANWGGAGAGGSDAGGNWGHGTASSDTFLDDIRTGRDSILLNTGILPNSLFLSWPAWSKLQVAPALLALFTPRQLDANSLVSVPSLAAFLGLQNIFLGITTKNTAEETVDGDEFTGVNVWGTSGSESKGVGFLYYKPNRPGLKTPSAGYQYRLRKELSGQGRLSTTWYDAARHSTMYDTEEDVDITPVGLDLGYMWKNTATA